MSTVSLVQIIDCAALANSSAVINVKSIVFGSNDSVAADALELDFTGSAVPVGGNSANVTAAQVGNVIITNLSGMLSQGKPVEAVMAGQYLVVSALAASTVIATVAGSGTTAQNLGSGSQSATVKTGCLAVGNIPYVQPAGTSSLPPEQLVELGYQAGYSARSAGL